MMSDDYLHPVDASGDDDELEVQDSDIEADPYTLKKLKEWGLEVPDTKEAEEIVESEAEASEEDHPPVEQEEKPLILGKYKTYADLEQAHLEAQRRMSEDGQIRKQFEEAQRAWNKLAEHPLGPQVISDIIAERQGYPRRQQTPQIPKGPQLYEWLNQDPDNFGTYIQAQSQPIVERQQRIEGTLNSILAYLEEQATSQRYGDTLNELQPYMDKVMHDLGPNAQYTPREYIVRMAKGLKYDDDVAARTAEQQTKQQQEQAKAEHREKAIAATVETANETSAPGKIIDFSKLSAEEMKRELKKMGAKVVNR